MAAVLADSLCVVAIVPRRSSSSCAQFFFDLSPKHTHTHAATHFRSLIGYCYVNMDQSYQSYPPPVQLYTVQVNEG